MDSIPSGGEDTDLSYTSNLEENGPSIPFDYDSPMDDLYAALDYSDSEFELEQQLDSGTQSNEATCIGPSDDDMDAAESSERESSGSGEETEDEEMDLETPEAVGFIENMVLDYLTQLNEAAYGDASRSDSESSDEEDSQPRLKKSKVVRPKIEVKIANRKKGIDENGNFETRKIRFPKATPSGSARPLAQLFNVLDITHEALLTGIPTTKRDVFYKDVGQFGSQGVVDQLVDDIAATWDLQRSDLNIRAASKGLVAGSGIAVHLVSGETLTGNDTEGMNIPVGEDIESFSLLNDVKWVIVVEKEAVFQTLCRLGITDHEMMPGRGLAVTGKGYPDVATRHLVKSLADGLDASVPIVALVDCDAFGLDILSVYRYGSKVMQHENDHLATRRIKWLGLRTSEMSGLGLEYDSMLPISKHDEKKILAMLQRPNLPKKWKVELMRSLHLRRKAEIEIISASSIGEEAGVHPLLAYLSAKMATMV